MLWILLSVLLPEHQQLSDSLWLGSLSYLLCLLWYCSPLSSGGFSSPLLSVIGSLFRKGLTGYLGFKWPLTPSKKRKGGEGEDLRKAELSVQVPQKLGISEFVRISGMPEGWESQRRWAVRFRGTSNSSSTVKIVPRNCLSTSCLILLTCLHFDLLCLLRGYTETSDLLIYGDLPLFKASM